MQRQLQNRGGMTVGSIRQKYGLGSLVGRKNFFLGGIGDKIGSTIRKLIPNEVANFAAKAAPFVAPFQPGIAAAMRGIGRYDKRGNFGDALKQSALTYGFGKGANYLGTRDFGKSGTSIADRLVNRGFDINNPVQTTKNILLGQEAQTPVTGEMTEATTGVFGKGGNFNIFKGLGGGRAAIFTTTAVASLIKDALTKVPPIEEGETLEEFNIRRKATVGGYLKQYLGNTRKFQNVSDKELDALVEQYNTGYATGGRVGFAIGNPEPVNPFTPKPTGPVLPNEDKPYTPPPSPGKMASMPDVNAELYQMFLDAKENGLIPKNTDFDTYKDLIAKMMSERKEPARQMANMGGMMDIPIRQNKGGITELDMRATGGFVPVGIKEKADDVPAMLSKNEFVMTADAVRAAGGGSIQKGAQKMYNTMKKLESRVS